MLPVLPGLTLTPRCSSKYSSPRHVGRSRPLFVFLRRVSKKSETFPIATEGISGFFSAADSRRFNYPSARSSRTGTNLLQHPRRRTTTSVAIPIQEETLIRNAQCLVVSDTLDDLVVVGLSIVAVHWCHVRQNLAAV